MRLRVPEIAAGRPLPFQQGEYHAPRHALRSAWEWRAASRRLVLSDCAGARRIAHGRTRVLAAPAHVMPTPAVGPWPEHSNLAASCCNGHALFSELLIRSSFLHVRLHRRCCTSIDRAVANRAMNESLLGAQPCSVQITGMRASEYADL